MNEFGISQRQEATRDEAHSWVAQFAPLIMQSAETDPVELTHQLQLLERLRESGPSVADRLNTELGIQEYTLVQTVKDAVKQLDSLETDIRKKLARVEPGNPAGIVDLHALQDRLSEREAKQEIGLATDYSMPEVLKLKVGPGNKAAAVGKGIIGLGWTAFTLLHNIVMLAGMWAAFGPGALALMLFYGIFYAVGFGLLASAFKTAADEEIELKGRELTIIKTLAGVKRSKKYRLAPNSKVSIELSNQMTFNRPSRSQSQVLPEPALCFTKEDMGPVYVGSSTTESHREELVEQINAYLRVYG